MNKAFGIPSPQSAVNVRELVTPRGVRVWLVEDYAVPLVSIEFGFPGGTSRDPAGRSGATNMLAALLDEGAGDLESQAFQRALDEKAIELSFYGQLDYLGGRMRTLAKNVDRAVELLRLALNAPRFDLEPFERVREQFNARIRNEANDPGSMAWRAWRARFLPGHPYGLPPEGTLESVAEIERADLKALARGMLARETLRVAIVGAIDATRAADLIDLVFADLPARVDLPEIAVANYGGVGGEEIIDLDVPQSTIRFGRPAPSRADPDHIPSIVLAHVLGGGTGLSSRLFREVREKRGLAYAVSASVANFDHASYLYGGTTTKNERAHESLKVIRDEILDMARGNVTEEELEKGKKYLIGSYPLRFDTSAKIAAQLVQIQLEGHGAEWLVERNRRIAAVTMADAKRTAERLFGDGALSVVIVGRPEGI
jgi:zinc protease